MVGPFEFVLMCVCPTRVSAGLCSPPRTWAANAHVGSAAHAHV